MPKQRHGGSRELMHSAKEGRIPEGREPENQRSIE
jgi:hypothetical protein